LPHYFLPVGAGEIKRWCQNYTCNINVVRRCTKVVTRFCISYLIFFYCTLTLRMFLHPRTKQETWTQLGIKEYIDSVPWCFNLFFDYCRENSGCWSAPIRQLSIFITFWPGSISSCKYSSSKSTSLALFILYLIACETFFIPGEFS